MSILLLFLVALAGGFGTYLRFIVDGMVSRWQARSALPTEFRLGILMVNVCGSTLIGLATALTLRTLPAAGLTADATTLNHLLTVVGVGLFGGFTTFSTASLDTLKLLRARRLWLAVVYAFGGFLLSVAAVLLGFGVGFFGVGFFGAP